LSERSQGMDFEPWQCHFFRDRLFGEFGSDFQSPLILALRAQYASPLAVPGRMRSPPSAALPACPNLTVRSRPVFGFTIVFEKRFSISESRLKIQGSRVKSFKRNGSVEQRLSSGTPPTSSDIGSGYSVQGTGYRLSHSRNYVAQPSVLFGRDFRYRGVRRLLRRRMVCCHNLLS